MSIPLSQAPIPLGKSGLSVSPLSWGMWRFAGADVKTATKLVHVALDHGLTFLDTAAIYGVDGPGFGAAESLLGEVLRADPGLRGRMTLATKGGITPGVPYDSGAAAIALTIDESLDRLGVEVIDLWMVHRPDPLTHPAEVARALDAAVASGKVRAVGVSNYTAPMVRALLAHLRTPLACNQIEFSPLAIAPMSDGALDVAMETGHAIMAWSPLGGGRIAQPGTSRETAVADVLDAHAARHGVSREVAAFAWIMAHPASPVCIVGSQKAERITEAAGALAMPWTRAGWFEVLVAARGEKLP